MSQSPPLTAAELDSLLEALDIDPVAFSDCRIASGWALVFEPQPLPGLHYILRGHATLSLGSKERIALSPRSMVITPPGVPYAFEVSGRPASAGRRVAGISVSVGAIDGVLRSVAGSEPADLEFVCGRFRASQTAALDLFASLTSPLIETFDEDDCPTELLELLRTELAQCQPGMRAMASALLLQVLVMLFRRTLVTGPGWRSRFALREDPQVSRAFSVILADPSAPHSIDRLAATACLSRSAFISRFTKAFGLPPMAIVRKARLSRAAALIKTGRFGIGQAAALVGYASQSSFSRAFRLEFGIDPTHFSTAGDNEQAELTGRSPALRS